MQNGVSMKGLFFLTFITYISFSIVGNCELLKPNLRNCKYIGYNILKCIPGQCTTKVSLPNTSINITMSVMGDYNGACVFSKKLIVQPKNFSETEFKQECKLSEEGKIEMAKLFKQFKDGNIGALTNSPISKTLRQECKET